MRKEEPSNNVKLAATNALLNSLEFTKANFDKEVQSRVLVPGPVLRGGTPQGGGTPNRNLNMRLCLCFRRSDTSSCRWCVKRHSVPTPE